MNSPVSAHNSFLNPNSLATVRADPNALLVEPTIAVQNSISKTDQQQEALLNQIGPEAVLELIAAGTIPEEIALRYHIRVVLFNRWLLANTTQEQLHEAKKSAAALYRARAVRAVEEHKSSQATMKAPQVSYLKLLAEVYTDMSKAMDPAEWNPRPSAGGEDAPLSVTFNMMTPDPSGVTQPMVQTVVNGKATEVVTPEPTQSVEDVMGALNDYVNGEAGDAGEITPEDVEGQE